MLKFHEGAHYVNNLTRSDSPLDQETMSTEAFDLVTNARAAIASPSIDESKSSTRGFSTSNPSLAPAQLSVKTASLWKEEVSGDGSAELLSNLERALWDIVYVLPQAVMGILTWDSSPDLIKIAMNISESEDMSSIDPYERYRMELESESLSDAKSFGTRDIVPKRGYATSQTRQLQEQKKEDIQENLPIISPIIDGRLQLFSKIMTLPTEKRRYARSSTSTLTRALANRSDC